jgi:hypothetical protein
MLLGHPKFLPQGSLAYLNFDSSAATGTRGAGEEGRATLASYSHHLAGQLSLRKAQLAETA